MVEGCDFSLHCTACGGCCDAAPLLTSAELFRFRDVFVGALAIRRFETSIDDRDTIALRDELMFRAPSRPGRVAHHALLLQGYHHDRLPCPALQENGRCRLHWIGKPLICRAVPLDPLTPDAAQAGLLALRAEETAFARAGCLRANQSGGDTPLVVHGVPTRSAHALLRKQRHALRRDRELWGEAVWHTLRTFLAQGRVRTGQLLALPLVPVVEAAAPRSGRSRAAACELLAAQQNAIDRAVQAAIQRGRPDEREMTQRLRKWAELYAQLQLQLDSGAFPAEAIA